MLQGEYLWTRSCVSGFPLPAKELFGLPSVLVSCESFKFKLSLLSLARREQRIRLIAKNNFCGLYRLSNKMCDVEEAMGIWQKISFS